MEMQAIITTMAACFVTAPLGLAIGQRISKRRRSAVAFCALSAVFGFVGFMASLLLLMSLEVTRLGAVALGACTSAGYACLMANARGFNAIQ
jgi:predicted permease